MDAATTFLAHQVNDRPSLRSIGHAGADRYLLNMVRSDEAEWWFSAVYSAVQEVPHGHVTSYAHIARLLGQRTF